MQNIGAAADGYCGIQGRTGLLLPSFEIFKIAIYLIGFNVEYLDRLKLVIGNSEMIL